MDWLEWKKNEIKTTAMNIDANPYASFKMSIELIKIEKVKNHLVLQFEGVCRNGSPGNVDVDYIIQKTKKEILDNNSIQSLIFDFRNLRYSYGNRFANLFYLKNFEINKTIYIRLIPHIEDAKYWGTLLNQCTELSSAEILQKDIKNSVKSINLQMNSK